EPALRAAIDRAAARGLVILSARDHEGTRWLPGSLEGVVAVQLDWSCPRDEYRVAEVDGAIVFRASGYARPIPGVAPDRNLNGISFAVANMTGFAARVAQDAADRSFDALINALRAGQAGQAG